MSSNNSQAKQPLKIGQKVFLGAWGTLNLRQDLYYVNKGWIAE